MKWMIFVDQKETTTKFMYKYSSSNNVDPINEYMYIYIYLYCTYKVPS